MAQRRMNTLRRLPLLPFQRNRKSSRPRNEAGCFSLYAAHHTMTVRPPIYSVNVASAFCCKSASAASISSPSRTAVIASAISRRARV